jgi:hypothetical protein
MGETIKVTNPELSRLISGLNSLDGVKITKDEIEPFEFADGVQWNLSKNAVICERGREPYTHAIKALMKTHGIVQGEQLSEENRDRMVAFQAAVNALEVGEIELTGFLFITLDELRTRPANGDRKAGKNLIPVSVLKNLNSIIKEADAR